jgi:HK97 family phage major capsid protein
MAKYTQEQILDKFKVIEQSMRDSGRVKREDRITIKEALTTADLNIYIPKAIELVLLDAAEPEYLASQFCKKITITEGKSIEFINFGALRASEIPEGAAYPEAFLDVAAFGGKSSTEVKVKKYGLKVPITEEMISDSQWDIMGMHLQAAGRAMARKQEEVIFNEFSAHGHRVFDADMGGTLNGEVYTPNATGLAPTGLGFNGNYNGTLSAQDFIDMCTSVMASGFTPTDVIMHPLCYSLFVANQSVMNMLNGVAAFGGGGTYQIDMNVPAKGSYQLPVGGLQLHFSPWVPFNQATNKFDLYIIDRNNACVLVEKDPIALEQFADPERDIQTLKIRARYGVGTMSGGLGIAVAKNIRFAKTWPMPGRDFAAMALPTHYTNAGMDTILDRSVIAAPTQVGPAV